jgi:hypothetical protein
LFYVKVNLHECTCLHQYYFILFIMKLNYMNYHEELYMYDKL